MGHNGPGQEPMRQRTFFMKMFFKKRFKGSLLSLWLFLGFRALLILSTGLISLAPIPGWAIIQHPSQSQILEAIQKGQEGAKNKIPPNALYWRFGASVDEAKPYGFLMTKLSGIAVMASHFALRGEKPDSQDIGRVLGEEVLQVVVTIFGDSPTFAMDSYLILKQGNKLIAPERLRFDARASSTNQRDGSSAFRAKVVASFVYGTFDSDAPTTIKVFPGAGGESTFDVDFSAIP